MTRVGSFWGSFGAAFPTIRNIRGAERMIVHSSLPVTLVGGAKTRLRASTPPLRYAPGLVAADGGAGSVLKAGLMPDAVIGDMDSI